jgi:GMP synthase-like glutamine amidotransferase
MKYVSVVQHTQSEWLGLMEDHLEGRQIRFGYSRPFAAGGSLPDPNVLGDGLILIGGGPWGSMSTPILPTLQPEITLARTCLMLETPIIGIGLGAQILSIAADGGAEPVPLRFTCGEARSIKAGALNGFLPDRFPLVTYMRDKPLPPDYAEILAVDDAGAPVLFQIGKNAFGFSGHPGIKPAMIEDLVMEFDEAPEADIAADLAQVASSKAAIEDALVSIMTGLIQLTGWMRP